MAEYRQTPNGLFIPPSAWPVLNEAMDYGETLGKAALQDRTALSAREAKSLQMYRKMGTLVSTLNQAVWANASTYGASEKPLGTMSHKLLREVSKRSAIDSAIITARIHQVRYVAKRVVVEGKQKGFTVRHKRHSDSTFKNTSTVKAICREIEDMIFKGINHDVHGSGGFRDFMVKAVQDELIIDRKAMIIMRDRRQRPISYHLLPPDDIKPRMEVLLKHMPVSQPGGGLLRRPTSNDIDRARDAIFKQFDIDVTEAAYVQEIDNIVTGAWTAQECSVDVVNPVNELDRAFYGISCLERSLEVTGLLMQAFNTNKDIFTDDLPDVFMMLSGEVDDVALAEFKQQIKAQGKRNRVAVMAAGDMAGKAEVVKVKESAADMQMQEMIRMLVALKCSYYRAHPNLLNFEADKATDNTVISNSDDAFSIDLAQEEGLGSLLENTSAWLTRELIEPSPEWEEYELVCDTPKILTETEKIEMWTTLGENFVTVDTALAALGLPTLAKQTDGKMKGDYINSLIFQQQQQFQQGQMQEKIQDLMGSPDGQGPPGQDGKPDDQQQGGWTMGNDTGPKQNGNSAVAKSWVLE